MPSKKCYKCGQVKDTADFYKDRSMKDGLHCSCKECDSAHAKQWNAANKDRVRKKRIQWETINPTYMEDWFQNLDEEKRKLRSKQAKKWQLEHAEQYNSQQQEWRTNNRDKLAGLVSKYRAAKLNAAPKWLTQEHMNQIVAIYKKAQELTKSTGIQYHVDHIIPLQGKNVSGLHVPWNLQILTAEENMRKHNKVLEDAI